MTTIAEVAKEAGVSVATVSRVLNNSALVSLEAKVAVENAIRKLNYEPNMLGRNLRLSKSRMILALLPSISNPFYARIIQGIENTCLKNKYNVLLCSTNSDLEREKIYLDLLKHKLADGVILMDPAIDINYLNKIANEYPIVQCSEFSEELNIPYVSIDNTMAAYRAVKHLITMGHRKIAFINSDEKFTYARLRKNGYLKALEEFEIPVKKEWVIHSELGFEDGKRAMKRLLYLDCGPTAVFAVSDIIAIGALKAIKERGLRVPQDIAVVGFDNISFSNMMNPSLTTVGQPMYEIGCEAAKMLIKRVSSNGAIVENIILDHQLIIRESTMG